MEQNQSPTFSEDLWWQYRTTTTRAREFAELWDLLGGQPVTGFLHDRDTWRHWLCVVHEIVEGWDGFDRWDWAGLSNVSTLEICKLSTEDFHKFTVCLLAFFIHLFITRLGYYPSRLLLPYPCYSFLL